MLHTYIEHKEFIGILHAEPTKMTCNSISSYSSQIIQHKSTSKNGSHLFSYLILLNDTMSPTKKGVNKKQQLLPKHHASKGNLAVFATKNHAILVSTKKRPQVLEVEILGVFFGVRWHPCSAGCIKSRGFRSNRQYTWATWNITLTWHDIPLKSWLVHDEILLVAYYIPIYIILLGSIIP